MKVAIVGAGGHAKEVYHTLLQLNREEEIAGFYVDKQYIKAHPSRLYNIPINDIDELDIENHRIHIAIGDLYNREKMYKNFKELGFKFETIIHPSATIPKSFFYLGEGVYIASGTRVTTEVRIGNCVIINTGAIISHDCVIEDFCTISPGAILCGDVKIGEKSHIGAGCVIREKISICEKVVLAMGSVVIRNILEPGTHVVNNNFTKRL